MKIIDTLKKSVFNKKNGIFELSRGKKLDNNWHQYILKYDFSDKPKPFIAIEASGTKIVFKENLSVEDLKQEKWDSFLNLSNSISLITEYSSNKRQTIDKWYSESISSNKFDGDWVTEEIFRFKDDTNFSNWIPYRVTDDFIKLSVDLNKNECEVGIPVEYDDTGKGYLNFFQGRFELTHKHILIWQNEDMPVRIKYQWLGKKLDLDNPKIKAIFMKN